MGQVSISGTNYDIYGTEAGAKTYFAAATHAAVSGVAWAALDSALRKKALVTATRTIDRQPLAGTPVSPAPPALHFPATGIDASLALNAESVPVVVEYATYELALALLQDAAVQTQANTGSNVASTRALRRVEGAVTREDETTFFGPTISRAPRFPTIVQELLAPVLGGSGLALTVASGVCDDSFFDGVSWNLNQSLP